TWDRRVIAVVLTAGLALVGPWVVAPSDLYPRFAFWLVPGLALAVGLAARYSVWPTMAALTFTIGSAILQAPTWTHDEIPNRALAEVSQRSTCLAPTWPTEALRWYLRENPIGLHCPTGAILLPEQTPEGDALVSRHWPVVCWQVAGASLRA